MQMCMICAPSRKTKKDCLPAWVSYYLVRTSPQHATPLSSTRQVLATANVLQACFSVSSVVVRRTLRLQLVDRLSNPSTNQRTIRTLRCSNVSDTKGWLRVSTALKNFHMAGYKAMLVLCYIQLDIASSSLSMLDLSALPLLVPPPKVYHACHFPRLCIIPPHFELQVHSLRA